ncbi:MAG: hypothetical protein J5851_05675 [Oscillospiraceae bacterium]|nr:hypothetical protein [Oscillospiraceae bacterium]
MGRFKPLCMALPLLCAGLLLTGCSAPDEVKQEASNRLAAYEKSFTDGVTAAYGDSAKLKSVECPVEMNVGSPVPEVSYKAAQDLTGKIVLNGKTYDATYLTASGTVTDTVHTEQICKELTDALPIDQTKVLATVVTDNAFEEPQFKAGAETLDQVMTPDNTVCLIVSVITSEDLTSYQTADLNSIPALRSLYSNSKFCKVSIVSLKDTDRLSELKGSIQELNFSYSSNHPDVYVNGDYVDAFEHFHIRNTIALSQPEPYQAFNVVYNQ